MFHSFQYLSTSKACHSSVSLQCPIIFSIFIITFYFLNFIYRLKFVYSFQNFFTEISRNASSSTKKFRTETPPTIPSSRSSDAVKISHPSPPLPFTRVYKIIERCGNTFHRNIGRIGK